MGAFLLILGCVLALALGIWLGLPGRYDQRVDDIERVMEQGGGRRRKVKRRMTPLAWIQRKLSAGSQARGRGAGRRGFKVKSPDDR